MNPVKHSPDTLSTLNFYTTSLALLIPCTSLVADRCGLAIPEVRHALPSMVKAVIYQVVNFIHAHGQAKFTHEILQSKSLLSLALSEKIGINFTQLEKLDSEFTRFRHGLFAENQNNFGWLTGLLAERTGLTVQKVVALFDRITLLTLKLLADIHTLVITSTTPSANLAQIKLPLTDKAFFNWLELQPMLMVTLADKGLIQVLGYQFEKSLGHLLNEQARFYKTNVLEKNTLNPELVSLATLISYYQNTQPLGIIPHNVSLKPKRLTTTPSAQTIDTTPAIFIADKAATLPIKTTWQQTLQRYWMLTAGVLTGLVFGGIALLSPTKEKTTPITNEQALKEAKAMPHDVAIMRVDSAPILTAVSNVAPTNSPNSMTSSKIILSNKPTTGTMSKKTQSKDTSKDKPKASITKNSVEKTQDKSKTVPASAKNELAKKTTHANSIHINSSHTNNAADNAYKKSPTTAKKPTKKLNHARQPDTA